MKNKSFYILVNSSVIYAHKFFFCIFSELFLHTCQTIIRKKKDYLLTNEKASSV